MSFASLRHAVSSTPVLRTLALHLLRSFAFDIRVKNPWTHDKIYLNSFTHKGYWFYGKQRERSTMDLFRKYVPQGGTVLEVGGHIGFISQYFANLVGPNGQVVVFEPGTNNRPYIERNLAGLNNVKLERLAISDHTGVATFFEDNITGQNNSLSPKYAGADGVSSSHKMKLVKKTFSVDLTTLDNYVALNKLNVDFVKIDIEGHEYSALLGARSLLSKLAALMVEVTENHADIFRLLAEHGFELFDEQGKSLQSPNFNGNVFAIRPANFASQVPATMRINPAPSA